MLVTGHDGEVFHPHGLGPRVEHAVDLGELVHPGLGLASNLVGQHHQVCGMDQVGETPTDERGRLVAEAAHVVGHVVDRHALVGPAAEQHDGAGDERLLRQTQLHQRLFPLGFAGLVVEREGDVQLIAWSVLKVLAVQPGSDEYKPSAPMLLPRKRTGRAAMQAMPALRVLPPLRGARVAGEVPTATTSPVSIACRIGPGMWWKSPCRTLSR